MLTLNRLAQGKIQKYNLAQGKIQAYNSTVVIIDSGVKDYHLLVAGIEANA